MGLDEGLPAATPMTMCVHPRHVDLNKATRILLDRGTVLAAVFGGGFALNRPHAFPLAST